MWGDEAVEFDLLTRRIWRLEEKNQVPPML
jgi:hypothetical protein